MTRAGSRAGGRNNVLFLSCACGIALCAVLYVGVCGEQALCIEDTGDENYMLLCILGFLEGGSCLVGASEALKMLEAMSSMQLCMLEVV